MLLCSHSWLHLCFHYFALLRGLLWRCRTLCDGCSFGRPPRRPAKCRHIGGRRRKLPRCRHRLWRACKPLLLRLLGLHWFEALCFHSLRAFWLPKVTVSKFFCFQSLRGFWLLKVTVSKPCVSTAFELSVAEGHRLKAFWFHSLRAFWLPKVTVSKLFVSTPFELYVAEGHRLKAFCFHSLQAFWLPKVTVSKFCVFH